MVGVARRESAMKAVAMAANYKKHFFFSRPKLCLFFEVRTLKISTLEVLPIRIVLGVHNLKERSSGEATAHPITSLYC